MEDNNYNEIGLLWLLLNRHNIFIFLLPRGGNRLRGGGLGGRISIRFINV